MTHAGHGFQLRVTFPVRSFALCQFCYLTACGKYLFRDGGVTVNT